MRAPRDRLALAPEVEEALAEGRAVVALESTIITHGMPWPDNVETARAVEAIVRDNGAVPATIAVTGGRIQAGFAPEELEALARTPDVAKLSRADLAAALEAGITGATTVAATMIGARLAGIDVFATGGIGGVHRGAELSFDVSADLSELARTEVMVVSAGAKALLDIPRTLEMLETLGVPVVGYRTDEFPAFWSRSSGLPAPLRRDTPAELAALFTLRRDLGLGGGMLVANPVPAGDEIRASEMEPVITQAIDDANAGGIAGKAVTPFVLDRIFRLTRGKSLRTNVALVKSNARLAAEVAVALAGTGPGPGID